MTTSISPTLVDDKTVYVQEPRRDQLDGLRAIVFFGVFCVHHFFIKLEFLSYALPVFFTMSGFLITRVLAQCQAPTIGQRLKTFYIRRMIRIFPAYYFVLLLIVFFDPLVYPLSYFLYYLNIKVFALSLNPADPAFINLWANWEQQDLHLWSLAVEEQFYLLYPLLFFFLSRRSMAVAFVVTIVIAIASRAWFMQQLPHSFYGFLLTSSMEYFAWGSFFAYLELGNRLSAIRSTWWAVYVPIVGIGFALAIEYRYGLDGYYMCQTTHFTSVQAAFMGLLVWGLWTEKPVNPVIRFLNLTPLVYLGKISYPMYLVHLSMWDLYRRYVGAFVDARVSDPNWQLAWFFVLTFAMTVLAASFIWHVVEQPASRLKKFVPLGATPVPARAARWPESPVRA